ncbi:MAG: hypothetical protein US13_C0002G0043 [candidate division TM6 bacterium GW2011_GWE2_36_25]|nr:MAG: hypothetical protein US03_C0002G0043 [candidate division TM6 bacterium GW2011_GWF2_36_131]KKQ03477.1 MAG: hypothetical protein US13_C0002G0043 [candidate division TM6 bacterium GW2011_GWE2_36_25]KKQ20249.1 MAG: hypothetical protein US32_C0001G0146 [candidate division TM6 bacterium GW2011_GWA2_36_9]
MKKLSLISFLVFGPSVLFSMKPSDLLIKAVAQNNVFNARKLLDQGVNANTVEGTEELRFPVLIMAIHRKNIDMVRLLLDHGADVNALEIVGTLYTPALSEAIVTKNPDINIIKLLLDHGANVDLPDKNGNTPLMFAVMWGHNEIAVLLIDNGADVNAKDKLGYTALIFAVQKNNLPLVKLLIKNGVEVNNRTRLRDTALKCALENGNFGIIRLLLNAMSKRINESPNPEELIKFVDADIKKALKGIVLKKSRSIELLKVFHMFARRHPEEFPGLEKEINQLMNQALVKRAAGRKEETFKETMHYQRTLR